VDTGGSHESHHDGEGRADEVEDGPIAVPLDYVPRKRANALELDLEDGLILYNRDSSLVHHMNPSARIVWHLCDGTATLDEIARDIAEEYGQDRAEVAEQMAMLTAELDALGLIEDAGSDRV
jgi:PqqD family protein of HPr-rel-A system